MKTIPAEVAAILMHMLALLATEPLQSHQSFLHLRVLANLPTAHRNSSFRFLLRRRPSQPTEQPGQNTAGSHYRAYEGVQCSR